MKQPFERPASLGAALMRHAMTQGGATALRFLAGEPEPVAYSYAQLDARARAIAAALAAQCAPGERAVLLFPSGPDYVAAFFGCLYAGVVAVPAYPPESHQPQHLQRLQAIIEDAAPALILSIESLRAPLHALGRSLPPVLAVDTLASDGGAQWQAPQLPGDAVAFLQYTSGSTATPKGVQVSHANLEANAWLIRQGYGIGSDDVIVSWLPLYHDMGLIGGLLQGIYSGVPVVLMAPQFFLERPLRWLEAISRYGGTISGGPDFAYRLCYERIAPAKLAELNLSRWRVAFSGSEPIRQGSLQAFAEHLAPCGFAPSSFMASYGLAEGTLYVTGGRPGQGIAARRLEAAALAQGRAVPGEGPVLMSCGWEQPGHPLLIVAPDSGLALADGEVGEIWSSGPSVAQGYWRNPEATAATFVQQGGRTWLRTGDLGFRQGGELYVTGRLKDMLIIRGQNLYPQDVERTVEDAHAAVRPGRVAVFAVEHQGREALAVAVEISRKAARQQHLGELVEAICQAVAVAHHEAPCLVALLDAGQLPKTSSGKLQRSACRQQLAGGQLQPLLLWRDGEVLPAATPAAPPALSVAEQVQACWQQVLKQPRLATDANFFALGGNSVQAIQMVAQLRDEQRIDLSVGDLYQAPQLNAFIARVEALGQANPLVAVATQPEGAAVALSPAQQRLWRQAQREPGSAAYNIPGGLRLRGEVDAGALQAVFSQLLQRHSALRCVFFEAHGLPQQQARPLGEWHMAYTHLGELGAAEAAARADALRHAEALLPFDLAQGPLLRAHLVSLNDEEHLLLVTVHHLVADGWSLNIVLDEFASLYAAQCQGLPPQLPALAASFTDLAAWQAAQQPAPEALAHWQGLLSGELAPLGLPYDRTPSAQASTAERLALKLSPALGSAVQALAQAQGATAYTVLLSVLQVVLHRYTGQADIRLGVPNAGRYLPQAQPVVGCFINTQVVRQALAAPLVFTQLLQANSAQLALAQTHQAVDFAAVAEAVGNPHLFEVMFNHQQRDLGALKRLPGLLADELPWHSRQAKFDLQLHSEQDGQGRIRLAFDYAEALFDRATIERFAGHYVQVLEHLCQRPAQPIGAVPMLSHGEHTQLAQWAQGAPALAPLLLPEGLASQARATPQATALVTASEVLSYAALHERAEHLARHLHARGIGPDERVALLAERSAAMLVGLLAIVKTGAAWVPLDAEYPQQRLRYMVEDSQPKLVLGQQALVQALGLPASVACLALEQAQALPPAPAFDAPVLHPANLAYVIYTSGSTGQPKGVGVPHGAMAERLAWMRQAYAFGAQDVFLQKAPLSFDVSVWECLLPLLCGARLVLANPGDQRDPARLLQWVREQQVTVLHFVPALLQVFVDEPGVASCASLRLLFSGGEALPAALARRVQQCLPHVALHNRYGPTEAAINASHYPVPAPMGDSVPIGQPLGATTCQVLDGHAQPLPVGVAGELYLGGAGLARGYLGRPGLTAERFVPAAQGQRIYRSGDRASWGEGGLLAYRGRIDTQVKLRGVRIEPEEVRSHLLALPGVRQAAVLVQAGPQGEQLVAYLCGGDPAQAREALAQALPAYLVPTQWVALEQLPLSPAGKLDLRALPAPTWQARAYRAPATALQQQLAGLWESVLGVSPVGLGDDFFALGGHSLLATRIVSRVRQTFEVALPLRSLFEAPELEGFAATVEQALASDHREGLQAIATVDRQQRWPLSAAQQRMWFLWQLDPASPAYNVGGMARLSGALGVACFEQALQHVVQRHETLRTTFPSEAGTPWQQVAAHGTLALQHLDYRSPDAHAVQQQLQRLADEQAHQPFDLEHGPLLRACLVRTGDAEHHFVLTLHHIITEGWAMDVFARELTQVYEAFSAGQPSPLPALAVQYLDYSAWHAQWLAAGEGARQLAYWREQLGGEHPLLALPTDRPRPAVQSHRGGLLRFDLEPALAAQLRAYNAAHGVTLFMTAVAALAVLLYRYSGQPSLRIGAPLAGRTRPETEGLIGAFLNTQVLRCELNGQMPVTALLAQVRNTVLDGQAHQDVPFDQVVEALQPPRSAAYNPLFQVMCNVQRWEFQQSGRLGEATVDYLLNDAHATKFDLYLEVTDLDQRLGCCFTYSQDLFDEPRIARMAEHWRNLLAAMVSQPHSQLAALPMFSPAGGEGRFAAEAFDAGPPQCLHALFAEQVARTPAAPALTFAGHTLSYAELDARANQLAHYLAQHGVGAEVRVGVALERSHDLVIGLLAILKAGGAYVPLDPEYPAERLRYMLEDSGTRLLLGSQALFATLGTLPAGVAALAVEQCQAQLAALPTTAPAARATPGNLAYVIYTSGSTGRPKGVAVAHGEIAMHCQAVIQRFGLRPTDCELHFYSINFDAATERLFTPLLCGARVVLRAQGQWGAEAICTLAREQQVNVLACTPSYASQLAQWLGERGECLPVRLCITGGEALTADHLQRIREAFAPQHCFNAYGPTETVVMPMASLAPAQLPEGALSVPIGSLVGAREAWLADDDLAPLPQGAAGELYLGGAGLARGYLARPALTAERFVPDPYGAPGARTYRSGDRVRQNRDGLAEYLGRIDQQVKIRGFRIELGEIEARLLEHPQVSEAAVLALDTAAGRQLVAYLGSREAPASLREPVRAFLREQLPDHMVPAHWVVLEHLPLMPNGKLDRAALPAPDLAAASRVYVAPRNAREQVLAEAWQQVLGVAQVGVDDNFFELGGDSILSIQVVSRARQAGVHFSPRELFQHQSVRALAAVASLVPRTEAEQGVLHGSSLLTPIQHWFFELPMAQRAHWNQSLLFGTREPLDPGRLEQALQALLQQHDSLRLRFAEVGTGWAATYGEPAGPLLCVRPLAQAHEVMEAAQRSLHLADGPLLRAVLFEGQGGHQQLLLLAHHLVVDGVSWRVLLEDLEQAYCQPDSTLPAKTASLRDWAGRLAQYAHSEPVREELQQWHSQLAGPPSPLPGTAVHGSNLQAHAQQLTVRLGSDCTRQLLQQAPLAYRSQVDDLLLSALARVLCRDSGQPSVLVQLESHGREAPFDDLDLTRSVGWFTSTYPLRLVPQASVGGTLKAIKEQRRAVPHKGLGYGVLRYLGDADSRKVLAALPQAAVTFNYLGQVDQGAGTGWLRLLPGGSGTQHDPAAELPCELSIDAQVQRGDLSARFTFSAARHTPERVHALARGFIAELTALVTHCVESGEGGPTPSDFPLASLTQAQLDALPVPAPQIEDVYPLTPMQEGLLLHTLLEPGTGIYYMQDRYRINATLDLPRFAQAWQQVVARHEALRASFSWSEGEAMLQVIHRAGAAEVEVLDWRGYSEAECEQRLQALHKQEREAGFDLLRSPPFHLRLVQVGEARYWFMMSNHHILIDAWCRGLLMSDFFECYTALGEGRPANLPQAPRYRDYIAWLGRRDQAASRRWWEEALRGLERATALPCDRPILREQAGALPVQDCYTRLLPEQGARLRVLAQQHQLTVNTFAQAAWALVLRRYSGERDVLFGVTVAGRPVELPAMQHTVGLFINSIPLRVQLPAPGQRMPVLSWLRHLLDRNMQLREHEYLPLVTIQASSALPQGQPLFDSLFVFENAPVQASVLDQAKALEATSDSGRTHTNFPLTVVCYPGDDLGLHLSYDPRWFDAATVEVLLAEFKRLLLALADGLHGDMAALPLLSAAEQQALVTGCNQSTAAYPLQAGYARLFEARVALHPARSVAACAGEALDYATLNVQANRLGHALVAAGVGFDHPVALLADRGLGLLGMMVGTFKAGAGYLPLDPAHPVQRQLHILRLSQVPVLVCSQACLAQAQALLGELAAADQSVALPRLLVWENVQAGAYPAANVGRYSGPQHLAYVIYTSGSTGLPKGVMVEQAGMLNNQLAKVPYLALGEQDVIAQTASQCFDISVWQFLAAPLFGGRVEIVPNAVAHDPQGLLALLPRAGITVLESVPSLIHGLLAQGTGAPGPLRWLLPTGEAMPPELARQWLQRYPGVALVNAYGPAECSDDVAFFTVDAAATEGTYLPIGTPTDNNRLLVLDGELDVVPARAIGELCIAGTGVGRGYVGDPQRTALAFVPNPHGAPGERLYRSGDLARRRAGGVLEYVGRADQQVKVRGYRIELGEIEARLHEHPTVQAAAVAVQHGPLGAYLVGYAVPREAPTSAGGPAAALVAESEWFEALKHSLRATLPDYMVPLHWCALAHLPLNANGKLDRKALPDVTLGQAREQAYSAPRTELERTLAEVWAEVLQVERVGIHDNFFELGGHSLLATQIASRVQKRLQRSVPLRAMFECHSVEALASYIDSLGGGTVSAETAGRLDDLMSRLEAF